MDQWITFKQIIPILTLTGCLILGGCLPPKTIIALPEAPRAERPPVIEPEKDSPSEEEIKIERLIRQLEETEQRLLKTHQKTEEALRKVEEASHKTEGAAERLQKAQEKIEVIGQKVFP
jgi:hypothetical protein